jgi:hypothetical protein
MESLEFINEIGTDWFLIIGGLVLLWTFALLDYWFGWLDKDE